MTKKQKDNLKNVLNQKVSLVTGTALLASVALLAFSTMPSLEGEKTSLLQASVINLASL